VNTGNDGNLGRTDIPMDRSAREILLSRVAGVAHAWFQSIECFIIYSGGSQTHSKLYTELLPIFYD